jgi:hypothetical protein
LPGAELLSNRGAGRQGSGTRQLSRACQCPLFQVGQTTAVLCSTRMYWTGLTAHRLCDVQLEPVGE